MSVSRSALLFAVAAAALFVFAPAPKAQAQTAAPAVSSSAAYALLAPKFELKKIVPKIKFKAKGKLNKTTAKVNMYALVTFGGKTKTITILNMGVKKKGKTMRVERKLGKLKVTLKISWAGERQLKIKGTARWLKFKVPMPPIKLKL